MLLQVVCRSRRHVCRFAMRLPVSSSPATRCWRDCMCVSAGCIRTGRGRAVPVCAAGGVSVSMADCPGLAAWALISFHSLRVSEPPSQIAGALLHPRPRRNLMETRHGMNGACFCFCDRSPEPGFLRPSKAGRKEQNELVPMPMPRLEGWGMDAVRVRGYGYGAACTGPARSETTPPGIASDLQ